MKRTFLLVAAAFLLAAPALPAAPPTPSAKTSVSTTRVIPGQTFSVAFVVTLPGTPTLPKVPSVEGLTFQETARSAARDAPHVFNYAVTAATAGDYVIPPVIFSDGQATVQTEPLAIHAGWPEQSDRMQLDVSLSKSRCYAGEPVLLTVVWTSRIRFDAIKAVDFDFPIFTDQRFRLLPPYEPGLDISQQARSLPVGSRRVLAKLQGDATSPNADQTLTFRNILIPAIPSGTLTIPEGTLVCAVPAGAATKPEPYKYLAYFNNSFFDRDLSDDNTRTVYVKSHPVPLEVLPLPEEGRPPLFDGLVGSFSISSEARPTTVRAGDPVFLTITITANQFPEAIRLPSLAAQPNLAKDFEISSDTPLPKQTRTARIFQRVIRPKNSRVKAIPPITLAFFDPDKKRYETVVTAAIPQHVTGGSEAPPATPPQFAATPKWSPLQVLAKRLSVPFQHPLLLAGTVALILLAGILLAGIFRSRHRIRAALARWQTASFRWVPSPAFRHFHSAARHASRQSSGDAAVFYRKLYPLLRRFFAARLGLDARGFDFGVLRRKLGAANLGEAQRNQILRHYEAAMAWTFTKSTATPMNADKTLMEISEALRDLDRQAP